VTNDQRSAAIGRLAKEAGVLTKWVDAWNQPQQVAPDNLLGVLSALTARDLGTAHAIEEATRDLAEGHRAIEPVLVAWDGVLPAIDVGSWVLDATVHLEDGSQMAVDIDDGSLTLSPVPIGYHELLLNGGAHRSHIFSAPKRAHAAPQGATGLVSPTYSMRGIEPDAGVGTVAQLRSFAQMCDNAGIQIVGTLPLLAAFEDQPSPYAPASRRAWNELFVDFDLIPGWDGDAPVTQSDELWVDYAASGYAIGSSLARYTAHVSRTPNLRSRVDSFLVAQPEMRRYAQFRATADVHGRNWRAWSGAIAADPGRVAYHETVQWLMHSQLTELSRTLDERGQFLYLDLPIGCHPDGYDIWDTPDQFAPASLGAPPDTLFVGGQDWGLPASIPRLTRVDGHLNFRKAIRHQLSAAGLLRIDHVMGIHRTWWVPHGASATQGAYVRQPTEEMFAIICIESVRAAAGVVGENLGTVPPEIRTGLDAHELLGIAMANEAETEPKPTDLVALSSHDTPAFAAWWKGLDIDDLLDLGIFDEERAHGERVERARKIAQLQERFGTEHPEQTRDALMNWMAHTEAAVALFNLDDLLMEERRQNVPGTDWERPNWRIRHGRTLEELASDVQMTALLGDLSGSRTRDDATEESSLGLQSQGQ
jgi:4-alpha-glucanotransferase